jgi:RNA polymerase sporulation-specific sigma factor
MGFCVSMPIGKGSVTAMDINTRVFVAAKNGDTDALARLMELSIPFVKAIVKAYYSKEKLAWSDCEDLTQDVLLDVCKNLSKCKVDTWDKYLAWLRTAAIHEVYNWVQKQSALKRGGGVAKREDVEPTHSRTPEVICSEKEQNMRMLRLVAGLREDQRDVFLMQVDGASSLDISEEFGIPVTTVYKISRQARDKMKAIVQGVFA